MDFQDLNRDTYIVFPADKGNMTIVKNTSDYKKKLKNLLSDKKLDKDPTNTIVQNIKILMEKNNIFSKIKSTLKNLQILSYQDYTD